MNLDTFTADASYVLGFLALLLTFVYAGRVSKQQWGVQRIDYIGLHISIGAGCASAAIHLLGGYHLGWGAASAISTAICHLTVTHIHGKAYEPPAYMHSKRVDL